VEAGLVLDVQSETRSFTDFAERLLANEDEAATELLERYSKRIVRIAGEQLGRRLATKVDPEDVLQSVLRTFYRRLGTGEVELRDWASLSGLLSLLTLRKCQRQAERFGTAGRDVKREVSLSSPPDRTAIVIPDREPTPAEVAIYTELVETMLARATDRDRLIIGLLFAGTAVDDVAAEVGCSRRTVYRTVAWIRGELVSAELGGPAAGGARKAGQNGSRNAKDLAAPRPGSTP
jgi:RNA polymerase sigma-70 factor (ECF subfamily)